MWTVAVKKKSTWGRSNSMDLLEKFVIGLYQNTALAMEDMQNMMNAFLNVKLGANTYVSVIMCFTDGCHRIINYSFIYSLSSTFPVNSLYVLYQTFIPGTLWLIILYFEGTEILMLQSLKLKNRVSGLAKDWTSSNPINILVLFHSCYRLGCLSPVWRCSNVTMH